MNFLSETRFPLTLASCSPKRGLRISFAAFAIAIAVAFVSQQPVSADQPVAEPTSAVVENVILVTLDGLRWQELFGGAELRLLSREGGVRDVEETKARFWREDRTARREVLMPFMWEKIAVEGQMFGDPDVDSSATVTNGRFFSYPGYNEILSGHPDDRIDSNDKINNENVTVLEWIHEQDDFVGKVAAFCSWDVFPFIINETRSGIPVNAGWMPIEVGRAEVIEPLNRLADEMPHYWGGVRYDYFTATGAMEYLRAKQPRLLYVSLGETDDWSHDGRYDLYLDSASRNDQYIRELWEFVQSDSHYRDRTAMIITTDHGRGDGFEGWKSHGSDLPGSDRIWVAVIGPGIEPLGIRKGVNVTQSQIAQTVSELLGHDFRAAHPAAQPGIPLTEE